MISKVQMTLFTMIIQKKFIVSCIMNCIKDCFNQTDLQEIFIKAFKEQDWENDFS